jgi:hypothetical protein
MQPATLIFRIAVIVLLGTLFAAGFGGKVNADADRRTAAESVVSPYDQDLATFERLRGNLFQLAGKIRQRSDLFGPRAGTDPTLLRPDMHRQIFALWYPLLDNYLALDALAEKHAGFYQLKDRDKRKEAFHLARGIFLTQYRVALEIIPLLEQNPAVCTILNEGDASLGMPRGVYAHFKYQYLNVIKAGRYAALEAVARIYEAAGDSRMNRWAAEDSRLILDAGKGPGPLMTFENGLSMIKRFGHTAWLPVQKGVAEWMGDTKVWRPHRSLIRPEQIEDLSRRLVPGDILLERREWYLTNVGIPGFWTHAALYIGSPEQRTAFSRQPEVRKWLGQMGAETIDDLIRQRYPEAHAAMLAPCEDDRLPGVIEAHSPGVTLTSLHYSATCDSLAVLRPRLSGADRAAAVVHAMRYHGRPYDYSFDFVSDQSLVCTELVVKSYLPGERKQGLDLPLEKTMGQTLTPANSFARQFDETFGTDGQQMDLVLFLDGHEKEKLAAESDVAAFRRSWQRPKWHILVQDPANAEQ